VERIVAHAETFLSMTNRSMAMHRFSIDIRKMGLKSYKALLGSGMVNAVSPYAGID
jgi:hypothetical protein